MSTPAVNPYTMSMDELRQLAEGQPLPPPDAPAAQPRGDDGRFVAADPQADPDVDPQADPAPVADADPIVEEREIDLGDGSGIQIFRGVGATKEEALGALADELAKAQANATQKIRELSARPMPEPVVDPAMSAENEFLLSQKILETPRAAIRDILKEEFGLSPAEIREKLAAADRLAQEQQEAAIANQFLAANPDYYAGENNQNANRLFRVLELDKMPRTLENLQKAYNGLKADGLIAPKPAAAAPVVRARSSGLSTRSSIPPAIKTGPTAAELAKMTTEQLRELAGGYRY